VADTPADAAALFVNAAKLNYHLRADAPVIGKGQLTSGESATDIDGDPRSVGGVSDLGADQFVNKPPTAVLAPVTGTQRQNQPITFNASQSADPEATSGGGIAAYHWNFGDGQTATTTTPTATHAYSAKQTYNVTVSVTDKQGASATSAPVSFTVLDGVAPTVVVATPASHQRLALYRSRKVHGKTVRTKRRLGVTFLGGAQDDVALGRVLLALRPAATKGGTCRWFNGRSALRTGPCTAPLLLSPTLINGGWRYSLPIKAKLPVGAYDLYAVAVDASGLSSATKIVAFRFR
jgi:hypothetical protein